MRHLKKFEGNEYLNEESKEDLTNLKNELEFINDYDIELHEAIEVIDKLQTMSWKEIEEYRSHLETNESTIDLEDFTLRLIDRYCSNINND